MNTLRKYYRVFVLSIADMFTWKLNFVLWRVRVILGFLILYFLWTTVFFAQRRVFGWERAEILTYILLIAFLRSLILSSRSQDVAGDIRDGDLTNYLVRPISYVGWWYIRDGADKIINVLFAIVELSLLFFLLRPEFIVQSNFTLIGLTLAVVALAMVLYFYLSFLISLFAFWVTEVWGIRFVAFILLDFLSGGIFPIDILPKPIYQGLMLTPYPYLLYFPAKVYLGHVPIQQVVLGFGVMAGWLVVILLATRSLWNRGLKVYGGEGR